MVIVFSLFPLDEICNQLKRVIIVRFLDYMVIKSRENVIRCRFRVMTVHFILIIWRSE